MEKHSRKGKLAKNLFLEVKSNKAASGWQYNRNLLETIIDSLITIGPDGLITDVNHETEKATGLIREMIIGTDFSQYFTEPEKARVGYKQVFDVGRVSDYELCLKHINGSSVPVSCNSAVYKNNEGQVIGELAAARDISAIKKHEDGLIASIMNLELVVQKRTAELINANLELAHQNDEMDKRAAELVLANNELVFQTGEKAHRAAELVIADKELAFQSREKADRAAELVIAVKELAFQTREKADRAAELVIAVKELAFQTSEKADIAAELMIANRELMHQKAIQKEMEFISYHDLLTGLYNRRFYEEELMRLDTNRNLPITLVMGDVNGLKHINDSFGHKMGDELLKKVAEVIKGGCRTDDIIARIGGDEFVMLLPKTSTMDAEQIVERINDSILREKVCGIDISVSFGYKTKTEGEEEMADIFMKAENHMYSNKRSANSCCHDGADTRNFGEML